MNVKLVSFTNQPLKVICWAFLNMHNPVPDSLEKFDMSESEQEELFRFIVRQPHTTVLEFVNTVWYFDGVSRAFQQQLTRTRNASYSIQSLRVVKKVEFADKEEYLIPSRIKSNKEFLQKYKNIMKQIQNFYHDLVNSGVKTEDARNILPLAIHSPITMSINLRALYHMLELRLCLNTQEEYRNVAQLMKNEIASKMGKIFVEPIVPLCEKISGDVCPSAVWCGRKDKKPLIRFEDINKWIKG